MFIQFKDIHIYIYTVVYVHILFLYRDNSYVLICNGVLRFIVTYFVCVVHATMGFVHYWRTAETKKNCL